MSELTFASTVLTATASMCSFVISPLFAKLQTFESSLTRTLKSSPTQATRYCAVAGERLSPCFAAEETSGFIRSAPFLLLSSQTAPNFSKRAIAFFPFFLLNESDD